MPLKLAPFTQHNCETFTHLSPNSQKNNLFLSILMFKVGDKLVGSKRFILIHSFLSCHLMASYSTAKHISLASKKKTAHQEYKLYNFQYVHTTGLQSFKNSSRFFYMTESLLQNSIWGAFKITSQVNDVSSLLSNSLWVSKVRESTTSVSSICSPQSNHLACSHPH